MKTLLLFATLLGLPLTPSLPPLQAHADEAAPVIRNRWPVPSTLLHLAPDATPVKKGDPIAVLDPTPLVAEVHRLEKALTQARAELLQAEQTSQLAESSETKTAWETAQKELQVYQEVDGLIAHLALNQALNDAQSAYNQQLRRFEARDQLLAEGFIQEAEYQLEEARKESAHIALELAKARLNRFIKFDQPQKITALTAALHEKQSAYEKSLALSDATREKLPALVATLKNRIRTLERTLQDDRGQLATASFTAPVDGIFVHRSPDLSPPLAVSSVLGPLEVVGTIVPSPK